MTPLPIDIVPDTYPPRFRWRQVVEHGGGRTVQEHEGTIPVPLEGAVAELIALCKSLQKQSSPPQAPKKGKGG